MYPYLYIYIYICILYTYNPGVLWHLYNLSWLRVTPLGSSTMESNWMMITPAQSSVHRVDCDKIWTNFEHSTAFWKKKSTHLLHLCPKAPELMDTCRIDWHSKRSLRLVYEMHWETWDSLRLMSNVCPTVLPQKSSCLQRNMRKRAWAVRPPGPYSYDLNAFGRN